ncbi:NAD(P)/FAD-dependent oxidoreductase [Pseudochryseolinea flava]|uniref:NADH:ubiquinone reductase (non-electrogenic) n=1 Tax=Pseudochryseolinea flava TaxID=2059302 RepID=A0A364XZC2_9BACT|nr:NAD(P)/FAD-dependent oxidoreductase [Pseudochryseolinea flava]RAV99163.1 NAD(P)/FAD-dependent oxidoreductase [Pseudochryseolinea flava]
MNQQTECPLQEAENHPKAEALLGKSDDPRVVIIGGGFAGVELAKSLANTKVQVVMIDRLNYHTFQPLLYQVATAGIEPSSIVYPFRKIFESQSNFFFRMADALAVDTKLQMVETSIGFVHYDYLVIASGATTNFYGNQEIQKKAIAIKNLDDALALRNTILTNFEKALQIRDEVHLNSLMDFVIVGGGPTGVEIAGALSELKKFVFPKDYPELNFVNMDIHLIQSGPQLLKGMSDEAASKAKTFLQDAGVKLWLNCRVKSYDGFKVELDTGESLCTRTLIWAAGVSGKVIDGLAESSITGGNRLIVDDYSVVHGYENVFAIGDIAAMKTTLHKDGLPMMAQPAMQQGAWLGKNIQRLLAKEKRKPFHYRDQGSMATIGRNKAVADLNIFGKTFRTQGFKAWFIWMFVHLISLIGFRNRLMVMINWMWSYFTYDTGIRLIIGKKKENTPVEKMTEKVEI